VIEDMTELREFLDGHDYRKGNPDDADVSVLIGALGDVISNVRGRSL
jgi:hypothetical protein